MRNTEKKYWVNGMQKRGKDFYTIAGSIKSKAFLLSFSISMKYLNLQFFNLTNKITMKKQIIEVVKYYNAKQEHIYTFTLFIKN
jgi:hypothetical protein